MSRQRNDDESFPELPGPEVPGLAEVGRMSALAELGLTTEGDSVLDSFAAQVCDLLETPVALVSLVGPQQQVFAGQQGLSPPWSQRRATPLSHSFCSVVVAGDARLVVEDSRRDTRLAGNPAVAELGVIAYAGYPLTDAAGHVLGALCAIDHRPRRWTERELARLSWLADRCSTDLRLRLADYNGLRERRRTDELQQRLQSSLYRSQLLLTASQSFSDADSVVELRDRIAELVAGDLKPTRVELIITRYDDLRGVTEDQYDPAAIAQPAPEGQWDEFDTEGLGVAARVARHARPVVHTDLRTAVLPEIARAHYLDAGLVAIAAVPVIDADGVAGVLEFSWDQPHHVDISERAVIVTLAGYVAAALHRIRFVRRRVTVVHELQQAMFTTLPRIPGLQTAARYLPADAGEQVGGDWYDVFPLPAEPGQPTTTALVIGDVAGHDIHAATIMSQLRAMLRQACWDRPGPRSPDQVLTALDATAGALMDHATATVLLAYLHPAADGTWTLTWSNAGHPPPIVIAPGADAVVLDEHDPLLGYPNLLPRARTSNQVTLPRATTVLLYTDGLVEHTGHTLDEATALVAAHASAAAAAGTSCARLLDTVVDAMVPRGAPDDIALLALRVT